MTHLKKILLLFLLFVLSACTVSKPVEKPAAISDDKTASTQADLAWWAFRYQINWPEEDDSPDFSVDLLLAHTQIKPVLDQYAEGLKWWRFHRRAARKSPGHQFSFLFYTDGNTATNIIRRLKSDPLLAEMLDEGLVKKTVHTKLNIPNNKTEPEAFSDESWSPEIQRTWPNFIMGVSTFWLALIDDIKSSQSDLDDDASIKIRLETYRTVDKKIAELWQQEGQHALLHHLGAVFGYKQMGVRW